MHKRVAGSLLAALIGLGGLAACGSASHGATVVESSVLANAYHATQAARSAKVQMAVTVTSAASPRPITESGTGVFAWGPTSGQLTMHVAVAGQELTEPARIVGTTVYVLLPAAAASQLGGKTWMGLDLSGLATNSSFAGFDPSQELSLLAARAQSLTRVGTEQVNGTTTTHYHAVLLPTSTSGALTAAGEHFMQQLAASGLTTIPVDVWIDSAGRPARISMTMTLPRAPAGMGAAASSAFPETTQLTLDFTGWGVPVHVTAPPAAQVYSMSWQQLQQLSGA